MPDDSRPLPDDAVVVVRGGLHSLDHAKVVEDATDTRLRIGYCAISPFGAFDGDYASLCRRIPRLGQPGPGQIWVALVGDLRQQGFEVLPTPPEEHFDVVLPDVAENTTERLRSCFTLRRNPARPQ